MKFQKGQFAKHNNPNCKCFRCTKVPWKGGITPMNAAIRNSLEYEDWRKAVFERDNYTCQICYQVGGYLHVDHIKPFALFPELRFELSNGRTLCVSCHRKTETYGGRVMQLGR